ncbi:MAG: PIN domain-containing protein, partial [Armatimonadota bacterium]|nr:PIN domain-containing protein [Armatimonadota bacterium]
GIREFQKPKVLDTNVIIDGRIADVCRTGFLEGPIYVPSFVLEELRHIADSEDFLRRARGRRGLDILNQMQKELNLIIKSFETVDPTDAEEVDEKLVKVAKDIGGCIVTNDFNLNKVAELHGVTVLNVNELANALKPVVLPGEELTVSIIKEGKESNQGIAYLDDGTMIVVEGGKKHIGETIDVVVTSVLQTVAGKMIFANLKAVQEEEDELIERNIRNYSSIRPRKKIK